MLEITNNNDSEFLKFSLHNGEYAISTRNIKAVSEISSITHIPDKPNYIKGCMDFNGTDIPLIDFRRLFGIIESDDLIESKVIIIESKTRDKKTMILGAIVDKVKEIANIPLNQIESTTLMGLNLRSDFIKGICECNRSLLLIIDVNDLFSADELTLPDRERNDIR